MMNMLPIFNIYAQLVQQLLNILSDKHNTICLTFQGTALYFSLF